MKKYWRKYIKSGISKKEKYKHGIKEIEKYKIGLG